MHAGCISEFMQPVLFRRSSQQEFKIGVCGSRSGSSWQTQKSSRFVQVTFAAALRHS